MLTGTVPKEAVGLALYRIASGDRLIASEDVIFANGHNAIDTVLRRASISGAVSIGGALKDHFADLIDAKRDIIESVALDAKSYKALKYRWARCKTLNVR